MIDKLMTIILDQEGMNKTKIANNLNITPDGLSKWLKSEKKDIDRLIKLVKLAGYEVQIVQKIQIDG